MSDHLIDQALQAHKFSPDGSIWAPESLQQVRDRLARIESTPCMCVDEPHDNALHDLAHDDVPVLLRLIERLQATIERVRALAQDLATVDTVWHTDYIRDYILAALDQEGE